MIQDITDRRLQDLAAFDILTVEQVGRLQRAGIETLQQFVDQVRNPSTLNELSYDSGLLQEELIIAAAAANLCLLTGVGEAVAKHAIDHTDWQGIDPSDGEEIDALYEMALEDPSSLRYRLLYQYVGVNAGGQPKQVLQRNLYIVLGVGLAGLLLYGLYQARFILFFPPTGASIPDQAYLDLERALTQHYFLMLVPLILTFGMIIPIGQIGSVIIHRATTWLSQRIGNDTDRLHIVDIFLGMSPRQQWLQGKGSNVFIVLMYVALFALTAVALPEFHLSHPAWTISAGVLFGATFFLGWIRFQMSSFREFQHSQWESTWRRMATERISTALVVILVMMVGFGLWGIAVNEIVVPNVLRYSDDFIQKAESEFNATIQHSEMQPTDRQEWRANGSQQADYFRSLLREFTVPTLFWTLTLPVINLAMLVAFCILAIAEYIFVSRSKGMLAFGIAIVTLVGSEYSADIALQIGRVFPPLAQLSITAVGGSLIFAVLGDILGSGLAKDQSTPCPNCGHFGQKTDRYCSHCAEPLHLSAGQANSPKKR